jgi:dolichol-phosphate mannosyltransferase
MENYTKFVCIPTYNEKDNIENLAKAIFNLNIKGLKLVIIDDNSPDGTGEIADRLAEKHPIKVIHRDGKLGLGTAYIAGFKYALSNGGKYMFEMDADFSHNPNDIPRLLKEARDGYQVVLGSRKIDQGEIKDWSFWRHFASDGAMFFSRALLGLKTKDVTAGFRCYKKEVLEELNLDTIKSNGYAFQEEMIYLCEKKKFKIKEVPITFVDRKLGESKLSHNEIIEFFVKMVKLKLRIK